MVLRVKLAVSVNSDKTDEGMYAYLDFIPSMEYNVALTTVEAVVGMSLRGVASTGENYGQVIISECVVPIFSSGGSDYISWAMRYYISGMLSASDAYSVAATLSVMGFCV